MSLPSVTPEARGFSVGDALAARGRVVRFACASESGRAMELWRLSPGDVAVANRLLTLGARGIGGFAEGGEDDDGSWLVRSIPRSSLSHALRDRSEPWPWREAVTLVIAIARAQAAAEAASLFAGPLTPDSVMVDDAPWVEADALVAAMIGESRAGAASAEVGTLRWMAPESTADAVWNNSGNRYAVGLIAYRLLGGEHPFAGAGLRNAIAEAQRDPPPFREDVARTLPPGLQSFCLKMIDPDPALRPARAAEIVSELEQFLRASSLPKEAPVAHLGDEEDAERDEYERSPSRRRTAPSADRTARWHLALLRYTPALIGVVALIGAIAFARARPAPAPVRPRATVTDAQPITAATTTASDCAACHPREAAEWRESVMAHAVKSPMFNALEMLIEEQVGRDRDCPEGAGILRRAGADDCRDAKSGVVVTGSGGEHWCVSCHAPGENLQSTMRAWNGRSRDRSSRLPVRDAIAPASREGISCAFCHQTHGPVGPAGTRGYVGNDRWISFQTGAAFEFRPEDRQGRVGIGNSGYRLDAAELLIGRGAQQGIWLPGGIAIHARPSESAKAYLASSEMCGACHDVRLFGTDVLGVRSRGEHFKRLRNAYSEWRDYAALERRAGRQAFTCQDCHMSTFPGVCASGAANDSAGDARVDDQRDVCPPGTHFEARAPGTRAKGYVAITSSEPAPLSSHHFASVDLPLELAVPDASLDLPGLAENGVPLSVKRRRDMLLRASVDFAIGAARKSGTTLEVPIEVENVGAGHKIPAGFSQERELWVHLRVRDGGGRTVYEVGRVDRDDEDLHDKVFVSVNTEPDALDRLGRPIGLFGANVRDGADVPAWSPPPDSGADSFRGRGLVNFQNGFLRCVSCAGEVSASGECLPGDRTRHRAERFIDGDYDIDTGECRSNLPAAQALFETYYPVGALDAERGIVKAPDAIIDTRALSPRRRVRYTYEIDVAGRQGPFAIEARLMFRAFPPYLVRAFAAYEARQAVAGRRPTGALVADAMMRRIERVLIASRRSVVP